MPKKQNKTKLFLLILLPIISLLSGCEFKDIDKDVFVSMIGIDFSGDDDKPYKISLKLYVPTSSFKQSPEPEYSYISKTGETLTEAIRILETYSDKELEFGHTKLIVIGEELLKEKKAEELLDFFLRRPEIQLISWVAVGKPSAEEVIKMAPQGENAAYPALFNYFDGIGTESQYIVTTYLFDFARKIKESGVDTILPIIEIKKEESHFEVNKSLVLTDDGEPHELGIYSTLLVNMILETVEVADLFVKQEGHYFFAKINSIKSKYKVNILDNNQLELDIKIHLNGYITESIKPLKAEELKYYNQLFVMEGEENFVEALSELTKKGLDPIGFGLDYKARTWHNKRMTDEEWKEAYKNAKIKVEVIPGLKSTGAIQ
ncbi:Ger(x)C family spore germination protein [Ureibacillus chungkukjangi]|uniref:Ger(x)C family spore germination protein n=1 Tax=Ureibacillus chungkukjangi TaxID=1202712 RepID=UPI00384B18CE